MRKPQPQKPAFQPRVIQHGSPIGRMTPPPRMGERAVFVTVPIRLNG